MTSTLSILRFKLPAVLMVIFTVAYFIDAANLNDLVPGTEVLHPDANESYEPSTDAASANAVSASCHLSDQSVSKPASQQGKTPNLRIVIDQDSPSVAAEPLLSLLTTNVFVENDQPLFDSYRACSPLYLLNCTLLI